MGYHLKPIPKGKLGEFSKIQEEYRELKDAIEQESPVLVLVELSDLLGAIEAYSISKHGITIQQLLKMTKSTSEAFAEGRRKNSES